MNVLDWSKPHHRFFEEISRIPHGSYHERALSDYLAGFARAHSFRYVQDEMGNVIIYKPASPGYEAHPSVALQAHMDMVWEKDEGYEHDFLHDPLKLIAKDGILTAEHTTLGIDDGSGVAYILAILDDPQAQHPPLEAIFTVQEEVGMLGAQAMDKSLVTASRFIGLDCGGGDRTYVSSLGGRTFEVTMHFDFVPLRCQAYRISVNNLAGGYSTSYLSGAENALALIYELLDALDEALGISLVSIEGGKTGGKVAAQGEAVFACAAQREAVSRTWDNLLADLQNDIHMSETNVCFSLEEVPGERMLSDTCSKYLLGLLCALPCGAVQSNSHAPRLIGTVINLTEAESKGDCFVLHGTLRAESNRKLDAWVRRIRRICETIGATIAIDRGFPAWEFDPKSTMLRILRDVFHDVTGDELGYEEVQGGIECSIFKQADREIDMITLGPFGDCVHTTQEYADLRSYDRIFEVFTQYLAAL